MHSLHLNKENLFFFSELKQPVFPEQDSGTPILQQMDSRDETFDILKGIAILFVILGHCDGGPLYSFIFSFHMPLFFFVTGYFLKIRPFREEIHLSTMRLICPYIFSAICICLAAFITDLLNYTWTDGSYTQETIIKYLLGFNCQNNAIWHIGRIQVLWFLLAMFWARILVVFFIPKIKSYKLLCVIFVFLGVLGIFLGEFSPIPYCIPQGLSAASFIYVGHLIKKFNLIHSISIKHLILFFIILWLYNWNQGGLDMNNNHYPTGYIFCLFGSLGAFFTIFSIVKNFHVNNLFWKSLLFCGRYSLIIYCVHAIERNICNWKTFAILHHIPLEHFTLFHILIRIAIAISFTLVILKIKPLRIHVFQIK